jgi:hypothetical protein
VASPPTAAPSIETAPRLTGRSGASRRSCTTKPSRGTPSTPAAAALPPARRGPGSTRI